MEHESYESWDIADTVRQYARNYARLLPETLLNERLEEEEVLDDLWELDLMPDEEDETYG